MLETERLTLRAWAETDAESLYSYAKDPDIGPIAGWPAHRSKEESLNTIRHVLNGKECYAICERGSNNPIGSIELKLNGHTDMTDVMMSVSWVTGWASLSGGGVICRRSQGGYPSWFC